MTRHPRARSCPLVFLALLLGAATAFAAPPPREIPGELIVVYKRPVGVKQQASVMAQAHVRALRHFGIINGDHVRVESGTVAEAMDRLRRDPNVAYVEPNYEIHADVVPNDPRFSELYGMRNTGQTGGTPGGDLKATRAWDVFTGDPNLKIGIIDTGIDYNHPDLAANVWTNP